MVALLAIAALLPSLAAAATCVQFDAHFNLYAFGGAKDVKIGPSSSWGSPATSDLTADGRPPFDGENMQCFLAQYANAMYVLGGDKSDAGSIYIYDFEGDKWSKQATTGAPAALQNSRSSAVLDHDTNVIFTIPGGGKSMYSATLGDGITKTAAGSIAWEEVGTPAIKTDGAVTAGIANNHIAYFGVPDVPAGSTGMFVIHTSTWQADPAKFTAVGGDNFPAQSGQTASFFLASGNWQQSMLFIPDDFSASYVVTHWTNPSNPASQEGRPMAENLVNSTQTLPAPSSKDKNAAYACSDSSCAQIDSKGDIYYIADCLGSDFTVKTASWSKLGFSLTGTASSASPSSSETLGNGTTATGSATDKAAPSASGTDKSNVEKPSASASSTAAADKKDSAAGSLRAGVFGVALAVVAAAAVL